MPGKCLPGAHGTRMGSHTRTGSQGLRGALFLPIF